MKRFWMNATFLLVSLLLTAQSAEQVTINAIDNLLSQCPMESDEGKCKASHWLETCGEGIYGTRVYETSSEGNC